MQLPATDVTLAQKHYTGFSLKDLRGCASGYSAKESYNARISSPARVFYPLPFAIKTSKFASDPIIFFIPGGKQSNAQLNTQSYTIIIAFLFYCFPLAHLNLTGQNGQCRQCFCV